MSDEYPNTPEEDAELVTGRRLQAEVSAWTVGYWGERCPQPSTGCACCKAWKAFDVLFGELE